MNIYVLRRCYGIIKESTWWISPSYFPSVHFACSPGSRKFELWTTCSHGPICGIYLNQCHSAPVDMTCLRVESRRNKHTYGVDAIKVGEKPGRSKSNSPMCQCDQVNYIFLLERFPKTSYDRNNMSNVACCRVRSHQLRILIIALQISTEHATYPSNTFSISFPGMSARLIWITKRSVYTMQGELVEVQ